MSEEPTAFAKRRVLIVGYPKSGNTWLTRLAAELTGALVKGFWGRPDHQEMAAENLSHAAAEIEVFKGHQPYSAVRDDLKLEEIVYMVRDPRDIAVSGANYFNFRQRSLLKRLGRGIRIFGDTGCRDIRNNENRDVSEMIRVLSEGDARVSEWCAIPWDQHAREYIDAGVFVVKYEDLLAAPEHECRRLLDRLGISRGRQQISAAIDKHNFVNTKRQYLASGDHDRSVFLREGRAGVWRNCLSPEQQGFMQRRFSQTMQPLGYD